MLEIEGEPELPVTRIAVLLILAGFTVTWGCYRLRHIDP